MKSNTLTKVFETDRFASIDKNNWLFGYYQDQCQELQDKNLEAIKLEDFVSCIKNSQYFAAYQYSVDNVKREFLYRSVHHGFLHNERVSLFAFYLSEQLQLSFRDIQLSLYAALYHDIGRSNDGEDEYHGLASANKLELLNLDVTDEELNILKTIITCHSLPDERFETIARKNNVQDINRTTTLFKILKDADALDRVRLGYPYIIMDMLRNELSLKLIPLAYQLIYFYQSLNY